MASRRMPWSCTEEWIDVYSWVFSEDAADRKLAFKRMLAWKSRATLPLSVDATCSFLSAQCFDSDCAAWSAMDDTPVRSAYGVALMRFVNTFTEGNQTGVYATSVQLLAARLGIAEWVVDARHSVAHQDLPGLEVLRSGAVVCLTWLRDNYWEPQISQWKEAEAKVTQAILEYSKEAQEALRFQYCIKGKKKKRKRNSVVQVKSVAHLSTVITTFLPQCSESFSLHSLLVKELLQLGQVLIVDSDEDDWPTLSATMDARSIPEPTALPDCMLTVCWPLLKWCQSVNQASFFTLLIEELSRSLYAPAPTFEVELVHWWQRHALAASWIVAILSEAKKASLPQQRLLKVKPSIAGDRMLNCFLYGPDDVRSENGCGVFCSSLVASILETCTLGTCEAVGKRSDDRRSKIMGVAENWSRLGHAKLLLLSLDESETEMDVEQASESDPVDWSQYRIGEVASGTCRGLDLPKGFDNASLRSKPSAETCVQAE